MGLSSSSNKVQSSENFILQFIVQFKMWKFSLVLLHSLKVQSCPCLLVITKIAGKERRRLTDSVVKLNVSGRLSEVGTFTFWTELWTEL